MRSIAEQQLKLELEIKYDAQLSDFSGPGWSEAIDAVRQLHIGMIRQLYFFGDPNTGKTHLLTAICQSFEDMRHTAITLSLADLIHTNVAVMSSLETFDVIAIDDVQAIEDHPQWQEALFHLINRSKELDTKLIFASRKPADEMNFALKDLKTRLTQATSFKVPDGHNIEDRHAMIQSILSRRGWQFPEKIVHYLLKEGPHRIGEMMRVLKLIQPIFVLPTRHKITNAHINEAIKIINDQTLLSELEEIQAQVQAESQLNDSYYVDNNMSFEF